MASHNNGHTRGFRTPGYSGSEIHGREFNATICCAAYCDFTIHAYTGSAAFGGRRDRGYNDREAEGSK